MSALEVCSICGCLGGGSGALRQLCQCNQAEYAAQRRYRRLLNSWTKEQNRRNYEPDDFDPPDAA